MRTHAKNPAMLVGGMLLTSSGAFVGLLGYLRIYRDQSRCDQGITAWCSTSKPGVGLAIVGGVMAAVGIPFIFIGARRVPDKPDPDRMTLSVGARGLVLSGSF